MSKQYSIAEARDHLPAILRDVERGSTVEVTRRGRPVAVILSMQDYRRLSSSKKTFSQAFEEFRRSADLEKLDIGPEYFDALRDKSPGRDFEW